MFNKSLVSIYFLEKKIFVVELNSDRKTVKKFASLDVPFDVFKNNKVADIPALAEILKGIWDKFDFKENSVNIVIPEFSTFTKLLSLPKLSMAELGEAINWQASQYLPEGSEKMILDWKIVERPLSEGSGYEVLVVSVPSDVLMGYVEAAEDANLYPSAVITPSVALTNVTSANSEGVLSIYTSYGETLLVCSKKEKIYGTAVLKDANSNEIIETAGRMISHYSNINIKTIYIGGLLDDHFVKEVKTKLGKEISILSLPLERISPEKVQEFLIPIAVQLKNLNEPADPNSLNLLPGVLVDKYRKDKTRNQVWSITLTITLFVWVSFIIVLSSYLAINQQIAAAMNKNLTKKDVEKARTEYQAEAREINQTADKVLKIKSSFIAPEVILNNIETSKVQGINVHTHKLDLDTGNIVINGTATNRQALVDFKKNLESIPEIKEVGVPINSFEKETNLDFELSFKYGNISPVQNKPAGDQNLIK